MCSDDNCNSARRTGNTGKGGNLCTVSNGWYYIKNVNAQKYLQVADNSGESGNNVEIGTGTGNAGQKWYLTNKGDSVITLKNGLGCMLDVTGGKNQNGTNIEIWTENGKTAQDFMLISNGNNQYSIVTNVSSGSKGLDVANKGTDDGYVTLKNGQGYMLDVAYGSNQDGTNIQTYSDNGADAQKFKITSLGNNQYAILTKISSDAKSLDVYNFDTSDGANVCQWTYYKNSNQIWYFESCDGSSSDTNNDQNTGNSNTGDADNNQNTQTSSIIRPDQASISTSVPYGTTSYWSWVNYGTLSTKYYYSSITNTYRPYNILLPNGYSTAKQYPVIYMLHGIGGDQNAFGYDLSSNTLMRMAGNMMSTGECKEAIIVFPNIRVSTTAETNMFSLENYGYYDLFREELINCLMPHINSTYSVKTGRENTAIAGFSMGGRESLYIGVSKSDYFGYVGAFCPTYGIFEYYNNAVYESGLFTKSSFTLPSQYRNNTFMMIVKGSYDTVVSDQPYVYSQALTANGNAHVYYETAGAHDETVYSHGFYNFLKNAFK